MSIVHGTFHSLHFGVVSYIKCITTSWKSIYIILILLYEIANEEHFKQHIFHQHFSTIRRTHSFAILNQKYHFVFQAWYYTFWKRKKPVLWTSLLMQCDLFRIVYWPSIYSSIHRWHGFWRIFACSVRVIDLRRHVTNDIFAGLLIILNCTDCTIINVFNG